mmetsp:Transcript_87244/g.182592  ORF Transcript_87244/g.182592 Transcript_87244/m.182592 type:complete len:274 (-) Transcript_87244:277-1098(-)|eukprot:CAMPEP_0206465992 /NCGR_PEP_ID=MMETSP0324_2-20121206/28176_1 /ASSEMBLY_ACC=CAM_ASM_000836 /TAXON_ID=2866 /ORGANISM="Crypthecodinium cohnii, Strain Seligo" /LENGTH=273 /DNA_ID=CAMNT_0053938989 /DNA_START=65 /DNA_END=886 /DNA_ORIENTATION=-
MAPSNSSNPVPYFAASGTSALAFFPLWKAAAIGQSGYEVAGATPLQKYLQAMKPPWRGSLVVIGGMTWARAAIFYGSDMGSRWMKQQGFGIGVSSTVPSLVVSIFAQTMNQPFVRSSIMIQKPGEPLASKTFPNFSMLKYLATTKGLSSLWLGLDAAILKTAPKYMVAVVIKDYMGHYLAPVDPNDKNAVLVKSAKIAVTAGIAGAVMTNPLDVVRNEMFKTEEKMIPCMVRMTKETGLMWFFRGINKNWIAVAAPIASTIFLTDRFKVWMHV